MHHDIDNRNPNYDNLHVKEVISAFYQKLVAPCLDNVPAQTGGPHDVNHTRALQPANMTACFKTGSSHWSPQLRPNTVSTTRRSQKSALHQKTRLYLPRPTAHASTVSSQAPQKPPSFIVEAFLDCPVTMGRFPSKSKFLKPQSIKRAPGDSHILTNSLKDNHAQRAPTATASYASANPPHCHQTRLTTYSSSIQSLRDRQAPPSPESQPTSTTRLSLNDFMASSSTSKLVGKEMSSTLRQNLRQNMPVHPLSQGFNSPFGDMTFPGLSDTALHPHVVNKAFTQPGFTEQWVQHEDATVHNCDTLPSQPLATHCPEQQPDAPESPTLDDIEDYLGICDFVIGREESNASILPTIQFPPPCFPDGLFSQDDCSPSSQSTGNSCPWNDAHAYLGQKLADFSSRNGRFPVNPQAQQVDSIFANRDSSVRGRLYSRCVHCANYRELDADLDTAAGSIGQRSHWPQHPTPADCGTPYGELDLSQEWVAIPHDRTTPELLAEYEIVSKDVEMPPMSPWELIASITSSSLSLLHCFRADGSPKMKCF